MDPARQGEEIRVSQLPALSPPLAPPDALHRANCRCHVLRVAGARGCSIGLCELPRLERRLEIMRPAFERPGQDQYMIRVRRPRGCISVIYDTRLRCLVTVWPIESRHG